MPEPIQRTNFDAIAESPKSLAAFLMKLDVPDAPWDTAFQSFFCMRCPHDTCPDVCPFENQRYNPEWWLRLPRE